MQEEDYEDDAIYDPDADLEWVKEKLRKANEDTGAAYERIRDTVEKLETSQDRLQRQLAASTPEEVRRLREENGVLRAEVDRLRQENEGMRRERDASMKQLRTMYQRMRQIMIDTKEACIGMNLSDNASDTAQSLSGASTARATPLQPPLRQLSSSRASSRGPVEASGTPLSRRSHLATPPPSHSNPSDATGGLDTPFEFRSAASQSAPTSARKFASLPRSHTRIKSGDFGSPMRVPLPSSRQPSLSLMTSPGGMSDMEGPSSIQYDVRSTPTPSGSTSQVAIESASAAKWRIHFAKAPSNARVASGPVSYEKLTEVLGFDEEMELSLKRLGDEGPDRMRLHITGGYGFVYDPVVLEPPDSTYFVDWGLPQHNRNVESFIKAETANYDGLHTFLFSSKSDSWIYIGHRRWTIAPAMKKVWSMLNSNAQRTLSGRRAGENATEFVRKVQTEELKQIGVELSSIDDTTEEVDLLVRLK